MEMDLFDMVQGYVCPREMLDKNYWQKLTTLLIVFILVEQKYIEILSNIFSGMGWKGK